MGRRRVQFSIWESLVRQVMLEDNWGKFECGGDQFVVYCRERKKASTDQRELK
jgi:hypothetical protein